MATRGELRVYLRRTNHGAYRLESEDGSLVLQSRSYRELRANLARLLGSATIPDRVKIMLGSPRRPPVIPWLNDGASPQVCP